MTTNLVDFLRQRLDEDEAAAKAANGHDLFDGTGIVVMPNRSTGDRSITLPSHIARFAARHDPARVLADVEAKRKIIEGYDERHDGGGRWGDIIRLLALPYADHPDYDEAWRPESTTT